MALSGHWSKETGPCFISAGCNFGCAESGILSCGDRWRRILKRFWLIDDFPLDTDGADWRNECPVFISLSMISQAAHLGVFDLLFFFFFYWWIVSLALDGGSGGCDLLLLAATWTGSCCSRKLFLDLCWPLMNSSAFEFEFIWKNVIDFFYFVDDFNFNFFPWNWANFKCFYIIR